MMGEEHETCRKGGQSHLLVLLPRDLACQDLKAAELHVPVTLHTEGKGNGDGTKATSSCSTKKLMAKTS